MSDSSLFSQFHYWNGYRALFYSLIIYSWCNSYFSRLSPSDFCISYWGYSIEVGTGDEVRLENWEQSVWRHKIYNVWLYYIVLRHQFRRCSKSNLKKIDHEKNITVTSGHNCYRLTDENQLNTQPKQPNALWCNSGTIRKRCITIHHNTRHNSQITSAIKHLGHPRDSVRVGQTEQPGQAPWTW